MIKQRLSPVISEVLGRGATLVVPTAQRQAAVRAAWAEQQRQAGLALWQTPRILTFNQYCEQELQRCWARDAQPDRLLSPAAEWAVLREARRDAGGPAEARALLSALHTLSDWRIPRSKGALAATPEAALLHEAFVKLEQLFATHGRKPLRTWLDAIEPGEGALYVAGFDRLPAAHAGTLRRVGAKFIEPGIAAADVTVAVADHDEHELELIASWCRQQLERDPEQRLLIVDANLRRRRRHYERLLSQTLSPSDWLGSEPRDASPVFSIEGGRPLAEFPIISHALLSLRLLSGQLRFAEALQWLNLPFLDREDVFAGASVEALLRDSHRLEYSAEELASLLERGHGATLQALAARLRQAMALLAGERRSAAEWAPQLLQALVALGWPGTRALRSDELQAMARWHALLDEYSALGAWLPRAGVADAIGTLGDLAAERNFDPASVEAPVTLTDSHEDPLVRYDAIWVAGLDAAQWPAAPRPDAFIPLRLQVMAGIPSASASGQAAVARASLDAWRRSSGTVVCSWARLEGDAHRSPSPLLMHLPDRTSYQAPAPEPALASRFQGIEVEIIEDLHGIPVDTRAMVPGGVKPLALQAECGFHAYAELRLGGRELEVPAPGLDARQRGMLLHKALELIWTTLNLDHFHLHATNEALRRPLIGNAVEAAIVSVFRGYVPIELRPAVERERFRVERLVEALLKVEWHRNPFKVDKMEARRVVQIGGGQFELRIDRIDSLEGGGYAILDYKSGEPRSLRWDDERGLRDPQLIAYLLAERGRQVQALANVSLTRGRAKFVGRSAHKGLLPEVGGPSLAKTPAAEIESSWQADVERWLSQLQQIAAAYIAGTAPVQPAPDTCRLCHLTTLCRRMELAAVHAGGSADE